MTKKQQLKEEDAILDAFEEAKDEQLDLLEEIPQKEEQIHNETPDIEEQEEFYVGVDGVRYTASEWFAPVVSKGPTRQEVEEWKERHGDIYFTPFESGVYIWRKLLRPEYREIIRNQQLSALDREEMFTEKCVLYPRNFSMEKVKASDAGVASLLSEMIMDKSGFVAQSAPIKL